MTLDELLKMPKGMTIEEYQLKLDEQIKTNRKVRSLSIKIQECDDALDVLSDERGSDRWCKWASKRVKYTNQMIKLMEEHTEVRK